MIRGAIFDLDGTLLDSMPVWEHASETYLLRRGIRVKEKLSEVLFSMSMRQGAEYIKEHYSISGTADEIVAGVNSIVMEAYQNQVEAKPGVPQLLERMKSNGIRMVVATSTDRLMAEAGLRRTGLDGYFERVFTCTEVGAGKRQPDIYLAAKEYLGIPQAEIWVFEDALYAINTAGRAGFFTVGVYDAASAGRREETEAAAGIYIQDFIRCESLWREMSRL